MNHNASFQRAMILQQHGRHADAERALRQALAADPHDALAHAMLSLCLTESDQLVEATREAEEAVGLAPDLPLAHYALAYALHRRDRLDEALAAVEEAIRLDPTEPNLFGLLAAIRFDQRKWPAALEAADHGLAHDPEHAMCNNLRAMALVQLGRRDEAGRTIGATLQQDPENAVTHANQGWRLLHENNHTRAMEHFREALRLDPTLDWARAGIVEALKAKNVIYRWMLVYFLWMSRLSPRAQWGIVFGGFFAIQVLRQVARNNPSAAIFLWPVIIAYVIFALLTWLADPLFNLMLRLNRFGRLALSREQVITSNWIAILLACALMALAARFVTGDGRYLELALVFGLLLLPTSVILKIPRGWPRMVMLAGTLALALLGGAGVLLSFADPTFGDRLLLLFVIGALASQFAAGALAQVRVRR